MSVRGALGGILASVVVLVVGWQIGTAARSNPTSTTAPVGETGTTPAGGSVSSAEATSPSSPSSSPSAAPSTGSVSTAGSSGFANGTFTGSSVDTRYGVIQVAITVSGGKITDVTTPQLQADDGRSQFINSQAVPILKQEVLQAQSAQVDMVSGATYTSEGYLTSLQAAIDKAR